MTTAPEPHWAPLSAEQTELWLASLRGKADSFLTLSLGYRLYGDLDPEVLRIAVARLQSDQDVLHSRVEQTSDGLRSVQCDPPDLAYQDLRRFSLGEAERRAQAISAFESARQIDVGTEPPARFRLLRLHDTEFVLLVTMHHIALDADSVPVLERLLCQHYDDVLAGRAIAAARADGYFAYARHQQSVRLAPAAQRYWSQILSRPQTTRLSWPALPGDNATGEQETVYWADLEQSAWAAATALAQHFRLTLHTVLLAAFARACCVVCSVAAGESIEVGVPTSMRWDSRWDDVVGPFIHTLPVRIKAGAEQDLVSHASSVREQTIEMLDSLDAPLSRIRRLLDDVPITTSQPALAFQYLHPGEHKLHLPGIDAAVYPRPRQGVPPFDLSMVVYRTPGVPRIRIMTDPGRGVTKRAAMQVLTTLEADLRAAAVDLPKDRNVGSLA